MASVGTFHGTSPHWPQFIKFGHLSGFPTIPLASFNPLFTLYLEPPAIVSIG